MDSSRAAKQKKLFIFDKSTKLVAWIILFHIRYDAIIITNHVIAKKTHKIKSILKVLGSQLKPYKFTKANLCCFICKQRMITYRIWLWDMFIQVFIQVSKSQHQKAWNVTLYEAIDVQLTFYWIAFILLTPKLGAFREWLKQFIL